MKEKFILFKINKLEKAKLEKKNQRTKAVKWKGTLNGVRSRCWIIKDCERGLKFMQKQEKRNHFKNNFKKPDFIPKKCALWKSPIKEVIANGWVNE